MMNGVTQILMVSTKWGNMTPHFRVGVIQKLLFKNTSHSLAITALEFMFENSYL